MPLLADVRKYADMAQAPGGREGCVDCGVLEEVVALL